MKKLLAIALLFFYLPAISGVAISSHLCCGEIASVKIQLTAEQCGHHSQSKDKNCCNDISHFFKIHAPQEASVNISCKAPLLSILDFTHAVNYVFLSDKEKSAINSDSFHSPPLRTAQPLFVRNATFLI